MSHEGLREENSWFLHIRICSLRRVVHGTNPLTDAAYSSHFLPPDGDVSNKIRCFFEGIFLSFIIYTCYIYATEHESGINMYSYISHFSIEISKSTEARSKVEEDMVEEKKKKN